MMSAAVSAGEPDPAQAAEDANLLESSSADRDALSSADRGATTIMERVARVVPFTAVGFSAYALRIPLLPWLWNGGKLTHPSPIPR